MDCLKLGRTWLNAEASTEVCHQGVDCVSGGTSPLSEAFTQLRLRAGV